MAYWQIKGQVVHRCPLDSVYAMLHGTFTVVHTLFVYSTQYVDIHTRYLDIPTPCLDIPTPCLDICTHTREFSNLTYNSLGCHPVSCWLVCQSPVSYDPAKKLHVAILGVCVTSVLETGLPTLESCHMSCRARAARALVIHGLECCLFLQCTCCIHLDHRACMVQRVESVHCPSYELWFSAIDHLCALTC